MLPPSLDLALAAQNLTWLTRARQLQRYQEYLSTQSPTSPHLEKLNQLPMDAIKIHAPVSHSSESEEKWPENWESTPRSFPSFLTWFRKEMQREDRTGVAADDGDNNSSHINHTDNNGNQAQKEATGVGGRLLNTDEGAVSPSADQKEPDGHAGGRGDHPGFRLNLPITPVSKEDAPTGMGDLPSVPGAFCHDDSGTAVPRHGANRRQEGQHLPTPNYTPLSPAVNTTSHPSSHRLPLAARSWLEQSPSTGRHEVGAFPKRPMNIQGGGTPSRAGAFPNPPPAHFGTPEAVTSGGGPTSAPLDWTHTKSRWLEEVRRALASPAEQHSPVKIQGLHIREEEDEATMQAPRRTADPTDPNTIRNAYAKTEEWLKGLDKNTDVPK